MMVRGVRPRRFQTGGATAPTGAQYASWSPAQQQAWGNGATVDQVNAMASPAAAAPAATAPSYTYNPYAPPSANATPPSGFQAVPFGTGTSVVPTPSAYQAQVEALNASPFMTPAALANQAAVANAGLPPSLQGNPNVTINGQQVPYNSLTPEQQSMLSYFNATGQNLPNNFLSTYQGPNTSWNSPTLNAMTVPTGSAIQNGAIVSNPTGGTGGIANPGAFTSSAPAAGVGTGMGAAGTPTLTSQAQTQASPSGFMGAGGGLGLRKGGAVTTRRTAERGAPMRIRPRKFQMGGANAPTMNPNILAALMQARGAGGQGGGMPPGGMPGGGAPGAGPAGMGAMAGALPGGPGAAAMGAMAGASHPNFPPGQSPGAGAAGIGAAAGAAPPSPGAAAMGAMAGAAPGTGAPGGNPSQQWGQILLGGAPGTGINQQTMAMNPQQQQALYRAALGQLAAGRAGMARGGSVETIPHESIGHLSVAHQDHPAYRYNLEVPAEHTPGDHPDRQWGLVAESPGRRRFATGGKTDKAPTHHASGVPMRRATGGKTDRLPTHHASGVPMRRATGGKTDTAPTHHASGVPMSRADLGPGEPEGNVSKFDSTRSTSTNLPTTAAGKNRFAKGGRNRTFDSTQPAPGNLETSMAGHDKFARGGKAVLRRRPRALRAPVPTPPYRDIDNEDAMTAAAPAPPQPVIPSPAPSVPPPAGAPFARGGRAKRFGGKRAKTVRLAEGGKWIKGAIKHPGALRESLGVPEGEKIPAGKLAKAAKAPGKLGQRARLAETLRGFHKAGGGSLEERGEAQREQERNKRARGGRFVTVPASRTARAARKESELKRGGVVPVKRGAIQEELHRRREARAAARGGKLCEHCGKAHGGRCKMAAGGAAKQRKGFPHTIPPPKPVRLASGGKVRGAGAAQRGTRFSGIF